MEFNRRDDIPQYKASGRERLEQLAGFVESLPQGMLTFTRWYGHQRGCAVGLAAAFCPWMQAQGLRLANNGSLKECRPVYENEHEWRAVSRFFEMSPEDAASLFTTRGYDGDLRPEPARVAAQIRAYLAARAPVMAQQVQAGADHAA